MTERKRLPGMSGGLPAGALPAGAATLLPMGAQAGNVGSMLRAVATVALTHARYWTSVAPQVRKELAAWTRRAETIPDPTLRAHALQKLREAKAHAETTATLAVIASRRQRSNVIAAIVALEVMYDYLDALGEQQVADPLLNGLQLFAATSAVFLDPMPHSTTTATILKHRMVATFMRWPAQPTAPAGLSPRSMPSPTSQSLSRRGAPRRRRERTPSLGVDQLREWVETMPAPASSERLLWWESAAGMGRLRRCGAGGHRSREPPGHHQP